MESSRGQKRPLEDTTTENAQVANINENSNNNDREPAAKRTKIDPTARIFDGTFFSVVTNVAGKIEARCTECRTIIRGFSSSTGNFKKHYTNRHNAMMTKLNAYLDNDSEGLATTKTQPTLQKFIVGPEKVFSFKKKDLTYFGEVIAILKAYVFFLLHSKLADDLVNFIVDSNIAFHIAQQPSLKVLLENVAGRKLMMPTTKRFMNTLSKKYDDVKAELNRILSKQKYVCVTCDVWSARGKSFIGVTVHYLSSKYERKSFVLAFRSISGKQSYNVLAKILSSVFKEYNLTIEKITHVVTDGGSAFCKAFRVFAKRDEESILVLDGTDPTNDGNANDIEDEEENVRYMEDAGEYCYSNILDLTKVGSMNELNYGVDNSTEDERADGSSDLPDESQDTEEDDENESIVLPPQRRCMSHLTNLVSKDFEKELKGPAKVAVVTVFSKFHALWVLVGRSPEAKKHCKDITGYVLQAPCPTRWNSEFDSIDKTLKVKAKVNPLIQKLRTDLKSARNLQIITTNDWGIVEDYVKVTRPVACALDKLQAESNGSQGFIIPTTLAMQHHVSKQSGRSIVNEFKRAMLKVINNRFEDNLKVNEDNRDLVLAAASLPRFKIFCFESEDDQRIAREYLTNECKRLSDNRTNNDEIEEPTQTDDDFFLSYTTRSVRRNSNDNQIEAEVLRYISDERKNDSMLDDYPSVRNVYFLHNTTLSASAVVERLFSQSLMIYAPRRNRLSDQNFEKTLLLKYNRKIFDEKQ